MLTVQNAAYDLHKTSNCIVCFFKRVMDTNSRVQGDQMFMNMPVLPMALIYNSLLENWFSELIPFLLLLSVVLTGECFM